MFNKSLYSHFSNLFLKDFDGIYSTILSRVPTSHHDLHERVIVHACILANIAR